LSFLENEIIDQYLIEDGNRPWIIGFSGGKDSTTLLQIVWNALKKIPEDLRAVQKRDIYVVCNDTLVENPKIVQYVDGVLDQIKKAAVEQSMPIKVIKTIPKLEDTFWVNLIGRGYPAPNNIFRWCTERLKINPTTRFITEKISEEGEVIILLGTRTAESGNRAKSMKKHERKGERLRKHILPNAFVYPPIKDFTTQEVWQYLMQVPSPWGANNKILANLYRNANSGDCPLVIDKTTPSCGNSRFGCWVCTVVKRDRSMEGLIDNGEKWMYPLLEIRDFLAESRDMPEYRSKFGRDGKPKPEGQYGPYLPEIRAMILKKVLEAQHEINKYYGEEVSLISHQELVAIQITWYRDTIFDHKVADIYNDIFKTNLSMNNKGDQFQKEESLLRASCQKDGHFELIQELLSLHKTKSLMVKKRGLQNDIEKRIEKYIYPEKVNI
ncbi:MAG: DNA phosphorothioation system sulfurtransferase DndC, partial [Bacteroidota bacterium]